MRRQQARKPGKTRRFQTFWIFRLFPDRESRRERGSRVAGPRVRNEPHVPPSRCRWSIELLQRAPQSRPRSTVDSSQTYILMSILAGFLANIIGSIRASCLRGLIEPVWAVEAHGEC